MPALQSLVVTDRSATPVNYTLLPAGEKDGVGKVALADATGALITQMVFTVSRKIVGDRVRYTLKFAVPTIVTEVINGVSMPSVQRTAYVDCTFTCTKTHTESERNNIIGMFASALAATKPLVHDCLVKDQDVW